MAVPPGHHRSADDPHVGVPVVRWEDAGAPVRPRLELDLRGGEGGHHGRRRDGAGHERGGDESAGRQPHVHAAHRRHSAREGTAPTRTGPARTSVDKADQPPARVLSEGGSSGLSGRSASSVPRRSGSVTSGRRRGVREVGLGARGVRPEGALDPPVVTAHNEVWEVVEDDSDAAAVGLHQSALDARAVPNDGLPHAAGDPAAVRSPGPTAPAAGLARILSDMGRRPRLGLAVALLLAATACSTRASPVDTYLSEYGGSRAEYERIEQMTDCDSVQAEYNQAAANHAVAEEGTDAERWSAGYMAASEERLDELDCPRR